MRAARSRPGRGAAVALCVLGFVSASCSPSSGDASAARVREEAMGSAVYQQNCAACHDDDKLELIKKPPKLGALFRQPTLPSGAPATDEQVRKTIQDGRGIMPPFRQTLDDEQLDSLLKYLHTR